MNINWYGQSCFRIDSKDAKILIDPFSKDIGLKPPRNIDDIVLVTHNHFDHNNIDSLKEDVFLIKGPGEYEKSGVQVVGLHSFHDNEQGVLRGLNTIFVVKTEGITVCHMGDLGQKQLNDEQIEHIGEIDILLVPVGGTFTIDGKEAAAIANQIEPKIIVPMHYHVPGLKITLDGPEQFFKEIGVKAESEASLKITSKTLPSEELRVIKLILS